MKHKAASHQACLFFNLESGKVSDYSLQSVDREHYINNDTDDDVDDKNNSKSYLSPLCKVYLCEANNSKAQSAAVRQICEADSGVLILAFAFVPRGFCREEIKTKSSPSVCFHLCKKWQWTTGCSHVLSRKILDVFIHINLTCLS